MKLLIDATSTQDQFAFRGIGTCTRELVVNLVEQSVNTGSGDTFFLLLFDTTSTLDQYIHRYADRVKRVSVGSPRISGKLDFLWWKRQYQPAIRTVVENERPDVYFCPYVMRGFPTRGIPSVVMIYDFALPIVGKYSMAPWYLDWIRKIQYHVSLNTVRHAEKIVAISDQTKKDLLGYVQTMDEKNVIVVHLGVSEAFVKKRARKDTLLKYLPPAVADSGYILYYAGIEVNKNVPALVEAYKCLVDKWPSQKSENRELQKECPPLVLAGGDFTKLDLKHPVLSRVRAMIREYELDDHVFYTGYYADSDAVDLVNGARLFVHLSLYEGFGFSPLEAMKCGVPVVASDRSCYPEVLGDGALLVDPDNSDAVADACMKILTVPEYASELSRSGMKKASGYTWEKTAKELYNVFTEASQKSRRTS